MKYVLIFRPNGPDTAVKSCPTLEDALVEYRKWLVRGVDVYLAKVFVPLLKVRDGGHGQAVIAAYDAQDEED